MRSLGIWTYGEWSELSRRDRARWLAFYLLEKDVEAYSVHATELDEIDFTFGDWRLADEDTREFKIKEGRDRMKTV